MLEVLNKNRFHPHIFNITYLFSCPLKYCLMEETRQIIYTSNLIICILIAILRVNNLWVFILPTDKLSFFLFLFFLDRHPLCCGGYLGIWYLDILALGILPLVTLSASTKKHVPLWKFFIFKWSPQVMLYTTLIFVEYSRPWNPLQL